MYLIFHSSNICFKQVKAIGKAICEKEAPVKVKHVRCVIMGTFQEKSSQTFWSVVERLPLKSSQLVCWKFCCILHKILQDGHPNVLHESMNHKELLINTGKAWGRVPESYGTVISSYCKLLVTKLDFHRNNPQFPGHMTLTDDELETFCNRDVDN